MYPLQQLVKLDLEHNAIPAIPKSINHLSGLKILNLNQNRIEELPDEMASLQSLEVLLLRYNKVALDLPCCWTHTAIS